ncbi:MAG TPA: NADH-quinone oxidoreductase subunit D [Bacteroidales bacterium]|nr:NADH-quinone oxidoreductase subunit D [Bacteroidales bacterium]
MNKFEKFSFDGDRTAYPNKKADGSLDIDLSSHKYIKVWQGPNHPGITGNMAVELTVCGDEVVEAKTHVGYLHRGFEKLMERRRYIQNCPLVCRVSVPEPDYNEFNYSTCVENLAGISVPDKALWLRTLALEMARLQGYLMWIGGAAGTLGFGTVGQWSNYLRDLVLDRFEELTGGRIYHIYILIGGVRNDIPVGFKQRMLDNLREIEGFMKDIRKVLFDNYVFKKRTIGLGIIEPEWIYPYGIVGPNARAAGSLNDVRKDYPYGKYSELDFEVKTSKQSDIYARAYLRYEELLTDIDLIKQILDKMPDGGEFMANIPNVFNLEIPAGETYVRSECTRGEYGYYMVSDGSGFPRRVNVRGPSYTHAVALLERMLINANIADVAQIMVSLHTYPPEIER